MGRVERGPSEAGPRRGEAFDGPGAASAGKRAKGKRAKGKRSTPGERAALLRELAASGESPGAFASRHGLGRATLTAWQRAAREGQGAARPERACKLQPSYSPEARRKAVETFLKSGMARADFARLWAISTNTLGGGLKAYGAQGARGLERPYGTGQPKGPKRKALPPALKGEIARVLGRFPFFGLKKIRDFLKRFRAVPGSTHQVMRAIEEEGLARPEAQRRRRRAPPGVRRFERARPLQLWQSDITTLVLPRSRQRVYLTVFLDDCSRYIVSHALRSHQRHELVLDALQEGLARYGKPREILTDQGRQYFAWDRDRK
ncbi:MAG: DDE-type integrase/transposase/recombinase [Planctomycetaceae bacterium]